MLKTIKSYMMPIAMLIGFIFYKQVSMLAFITPFLIGLMLFFTYCNVSFERIRFSKFHYILLGVQLVGSALLYCIFLPFDEVLAQGAMICMLAPTATAAPVIAGMLGGNVESLAAYSLLCNLVIAVVAPISFAITGTVDAASFGYSVFIIGQKVFVLLIFPFVLAFLLYKIFPQIHQKVKQLKAVSFYLWSFALIIITGNTVQFVVNQATNYFIEIGLAVIALVTCILQFVIGRYVGRKYGNVVSGGQGLGQKNTILAIWMAQTYLNPISSVAPGAYVLWQNMVNSFQVWRASRKGTIVN